MYVNYIYDCLHSTCKLLYFKHSSQRPAWFESSASTLKEWVLRRYIKKATLKAVIFDTIFSVWQVTISQPFRFSIMLLKIFKLNVGSCSTETCYYAALRSPFFANRSKTSASSVTTHDIFDISLSFICWATVCTFTAVLGLALLGFIKPLGPSSKPPPRPVLHRLVHWAEL